jgi:tetratricopeptide (TPR) repeat protein
VTAATAAHASHSPGRWRRWLRVVVILAIGAAGLLIAYPPRPPALEPATHSRQMHEKEVQTRFQQAILMLHAKQYEGAAAALQRVLQLSPRMPEAHVNMGFAMLGLDRPGEAAVAFERAIELNARQANAYYGLALALEKAGDVERALGAMRSYLHLSPPDERFHAKARAAIWEWEQQLGRHPPSPPGTTQPR